MGRELICLWVGDVGICQELMTFMILFGFLPHSLVSRDGYRQKLCIAIYRDTQPAYRDTYHDIL